MNIKWIHQGFVKASNTALDSNSDIFIGDETHLHLLCKFPWKKDHTSRSLKLTNRKKK